MILEYADPKDTIRELKKALVWTRIKATLAIILVAGVAGVMGFHEGYRRGCEDTINVVESKLDSLFKRLTGG